MSIQAPEITNAALPRRFVLCRDEDVSGISGTGVVAEGIEFWDGKVALRWRSLIASSAIYDHIDDVVEIHGHEGRTRVVWLDEQGQRFIDGAKG